MKRGSRMGVLQRSSYKQNTDESDVGAKFLPSLAHVALASSASSEVN